MQNFHESWNCKGSPSVQHISNSFSALKIPHFHTKNSSVPHIPQFNTKNPSVPHKIALYKRAFFALDPDQTLFFHESRLVLCVEYNAGLRFVLEVIVDVIKNKNAQRSKNSHYYDSLAPPNNGLIYSSR